MKAEESGREELYSIMILTEVYGNIQDITDLGSWHVETALVKSDDLLKSILRVTSDHGRDYGIRLGDESQRLENGSAFVLGPGKLLVLSVIPDEVIVISPSGMDEMGRTAHMLGNLHKPVQIRDGRITLLMDPVVLKTLKENGTEFTVEKVQLDQPMQYANLTPGSHAHSHTHHADEH
jgi:urease accessory protein